MANTVVIDLQQERSEDFQIEGSVFFGTTPWVPISGENVAFVLEQGDSNILTRDIGTGITFDSNKSYHLTIPRTAFSSSVLPRSSYSYRIDVMYFNDRSELVTETPIKGTILFTGTE